MLTQTSLINDPIYKWSLTFECDSSCQIRLPVRPVIEDENINNISFYVEVNGEFLYTFTVPDFLEYQVPSISFDNAGTYVVNIYSRNWDGSYLYPAWFTEFRYRLTSINTPIPKVLGMFDPYYNTYYDHSFIDLFSECNIISIPEDIFKYNTDIVSVENCFSSCNNLTSIPEYLFSKCTQLTNFRRCFCYCQNLVSIPEDLFKYNTEATSFIECFRSCSNLTSIPENLFKYNTEATAFASCFYYCNGLQSIPENLFKYNTEAINFGSCFDNCSSVTSIPENLFKYNTKVTTVSSCFRYCNITTIPENIFKYNTDIIYFSGCFIGCPITSIPEHLFDNNVNTLYFIECFKGCSSLATIPENLFKYNVKATEFNYCFSGCSNLTTIPDNLFKYNTSVTLFQNCFQYCTNLTNLNLHIGSPIVYRADAFVTKKYSTIRNIYVPDVGIGTDIGTIYMTTGSIYYFKFNVVLDLEGNSIIQFQGASSDIENLEFISESSTSTSVSGKIVWTRPSYYDYDNPLSPKFNSWSSSTSSIITNSPYTLSNYTITFTSIKRTSPYELGVNITWSGNSTYKRATQIAFETVSSSLGLTIIGE